MGLQATSGSPPPHDPGISSLYAQESEEAEGPIFWLPQEVILNGILPYLNIRDLAAFQKTCRYFYGMIREHAVHILGTPHALSIVAKYGFEPLTDPRNRIIIRKAFEACVFEGVGDGLTPETLGNKLQTVENRNLVKIYYHFQHGSVPSTIGALTDRLWVLSRSNDISTIASRIRERFKHEKTLSNRFRFNIDSISYLHLQSLSQSKALPCCYRYISVIPPEIQYFATCGIHAPGNRLMLISRNIHKALRETFRGSPKFGEIVGDLDIENNQLGPLPIEARELWKLQQDGSHVPVFEQKQKTPVSLNEKTT